MNSSGNQTKHAIGAETSGSASPHKGKSAKPPGVDTGSHASRRSAAVAAAASAGLLVRNAFRPEEVAFKIGLGETTTRGLIRDGRIKHLNIGTAIIVPQAAIDEFLAEASATGEAKR